MSAMITFQSCQETRLLLSRTITRNLFSEFNPLCYTDFRYNDEMILTWNKTEHRLWT